MAHRRWTALVALVVAMFGRSDALVVSPTTRAANAAVAAARCGAPIAGGAKDGIFTPLVKLAARVTGRKELNAFRAEVIAQHTKVIQAFVETSDTAFGKLALKKLFELADKDGNGVIDEEELKDALNKLGFSYLTDSQIAQILARSDEDENAVLDLEEFVAGAPKTLKVNLVKLAKKNGADLGFLS